jgi:hypothetical protein
LNWIGGVLGPDGKIYGIPSYASDILVIDPLAGTATRTAMGANLTGTYKWIAGDVGADGRIYGIPFNTQDVLAIDTVTGTATRSNFGLGPAAFLDWNGGAVAPDGRVFGIPRSNRDVLVIDPGDASSTTTVTVTVTDPGLDGPRSTSTPVDVHIAVAPGPPAVSVVATSPTSARVTVTPPTSDGRSPITGYQLDLSAVAHLPGGTGTRITMGSATTYDITGLPAGATRYVRVRATNAVGPGRWSAQAGVTLPAAG